MLVRAIPACLWVTIESCVIPHFRILALRMIPVMCTVKNHIEPHPLPLSKSFELKSKVYSEYGGTTLNLQTGQARTEVNAP